MSELNKTYRINTDIGDNLKDDFITISTELTQDYEAFDILSVNIKSSDLYKLHNSNYGVVVGRVLANNGFGAPNAKLSIFIESDSYDGDKIRELYPFITTRSTDSDGVRYNLLPDEKVSDCHQIVGTFPNKRFVLDDDTLIEVFDKYYKFTTKTNNAGDYLIMGVPVGNQILHMDLDLSDCGILSQRPRDFVYKGYTIEQFENPNKFKAGANFEELSQVFTQDQTINVQPFWGDSSLGEKIGITRADIKISFTFQPTCVFIGCIASDSASQGITKKCMATENMGNMEEMTTGEGTIEMIRKTPSGDIEEFQVKGTQLIDANGVWCYQIPMNLDYMMTDEYGNMVPTDDPSKGIPTRCSARFRISMQDNESNVDNFFRAKVLVPHNPQNTTGGTHEEYDYEFGSKTRDDSFRDLFWNNVYTVKSYIPRFQKRRVLAWKDKKFTGIKNCNFFGNNNPIPYNNIRIRIPFMFTVMCAIIKCFIFITGIFNFFISLFGWMLADIGNTKIVGWYPFRKLYDKALDLKLNVLSEGLCPDLDNWFFSPLKNTNYLRNPNPPKKRKRYNLLLQTLDSLREEEAFQDPQSIDLNNSESEDEIYCLTTKVDYLIHCVEMNLAMEYRVIKFDFYNDWINGFIYIPRFMRYVRPKKTFLGITFARAKVKGCMDDTKIFSKTRRYTQQCAIGYRANDVNKSVVYTNVEDPLAKGVTKKHIKRANNYHKSNGLSQKTIFGNNGGVCHEHTTSKGHHVYYMKPCEWHQNNTPANSKTILFATDLVLLGSLNDCDQNGLPQAFKYLSSTSYIMPTNLALTNMETNGPLYANDRGTICAGTSSRSPEAYDASDDKGIQIIPVENGLTGEITFFEKANDANIATDYDGQELSDIIALTEAAGISWNYTGPGQGTPNERLMYQPGGHFLGLSCTNSQTNLKSCVNLERICEVGANLSQRKEDVRKITDNGDLKYVYTAPTGFISGDDIVAEDFRAMFSTMNKKRLIADKINPLTGYKMYNFEYNHPVNFDGSFKNVIKRGNSLYNNKNNNLVPEEDDSVFSRVGIETNGLKRPDYDSEEYENTQTRTIEDTSLDYYLFRFGLNKDTDLGKVNEIQLRKFLKAEGNKYYLPQYENSYYFYFGMKDGVSAIDEFNKQFFSVCETTTVNLGEPYINFSLTEMDICEGTQNINLVIENLETPYNSITYTIEGDTDKEKDGYILNVYDIFRKDDNGNYVENIIGNEYSTIITLKNKGFGRYNFTVIDSEGVTVNKKIVIGEDILSADITPFDFNVSDYTTLNRVASKPRINDILGTAVETKAGDLIMKTPVCTTDVITCFVEVCKEINDCPYDEGSGTTCNPFENSCPQNTFCTCEIYVPCETSPCDNEPGDDTNNDWENNDDIDKPIDDIELMFQGGYIGVKNLKVIPKYSNLITGTRVIVRSVEDYNGQPLEETIAIPVSGSTSISVASANVIYDVFLSYTCNGVKWHDIYYSSYIIHDGSSVTLNMGWKNLGLYETVKASGGFLNYGNDSWWTSIDKNQTNKELQKSDWLKKLCLFKETDNTATFSNNVFASNGYKVLWGTPQNNEGFISGSDRYEKIIYSSESEATVDLDDYTLDDDFSYYGTLPSSDYNNNAVNYSAIAINGTTVAGDYWGTLEDGSISVMNNIPYNSGYVFKPLPYGELQFHVKKGQLKYDKYINPDGTVNKYITGRDEEEFKNNGGTVIKYGVFYPSFIYPVIEYPFTVDIDFYVWERKHVYQEEGGDDKKYGSVTMGGRTEMKIKNGISFNGRFNDVLVSNIKTKELLDKIEKNINKNGDIEAITGRDREINITGMTPHFESEESDQDVIFKDAVVSVKYSGSYRDVAIGYSGLTEMYYNFIEGTPSEYENVDGKIISSGVLESLTNVINGAFDIENEFSDYITYQRVGNGCKFYRNNSDMPYNFGNREKSNVKLYVGPTSNPVAFMGPVVDSSLSYAYHQIGRNFYILCTYNENIGTVHNNVNSEVGVTSRVGDFAILSLERSGAFNYKWRIPYHTDDGIFEQKGTIPWLGNDFNSAFVTINANTSNFIGTPVLNSLIAAYPDNLNLGKSWKECINYYNNEVAINGDIINFDYPLINPFAVEVIERKTSNGTVRLNKIFTSVTLKPIDYDDVSISKTNWYIDGTSAETWSITTFIVVFYDLERNYVRTPDDNDINLTLETIGNNIFEDSRAILRLDSRTKDSTNNYITYTFTVSGCSITGKTEDVIPFYFYINTPGQGKSFAISRTRYVPPVDFYINFIGNIQQPGDIIPVLYGDRIAVEEIYSIVEGNKDSGENVDEQVLVSVEGRNAENKLHSIAIKSDSQYYKVFVMLGATGYPPNDNGSGEDGYYDMKKDESEGRWIYTYTLPTPIKFETIANGGNQLFIYVKYTGETPEN